MRCVKVRRLLSAYVDETLNISVDERVRLHLDHCPDCARLAGDLRQSVTRLRELPPLVTSPDFMTNLHRHLSVAEGLSHRPLEPVGMRMRFAHWLLRGRKRRFGLVLAPVALGLSLGLYLWSAGSLPLPAPAFAEPVITENAYLESVAREHAGFASEHPLMDTSAANLTVTLASTSGH